MKNDWIPTDKTMPANGQKVLYLILNEPINGLAYYSFGLGYYSDEYRQWFNCGDRHNIMWPKYWMNIPEFPPIKD